MQNQEPKITDTTLSQPKVSTSTHVVTAEAVQAEEVPTIPLGSLQTISTLQPEVEVHSVAATRAVSMPVPLVVQPSEYRRSMFDWLSIWWDGIRPAYLPLSLMPVLVGTTLAWTPTITPQHPLGHLHFTHLLATLVAVALLHIGANLVNDYYDYLRGIDTSNAFGPGGLIQQGLIRPANVLTIGLGALCIGAIIGLVLVLSSSPLLLLLGLVGLLCAYFYSATTHSLSSMLLGELAAFLVFGPLITLGAYVVQTRVSSSVVLPYGIALGLLAVATIHANNMRDSEGDRHARKLTFAALLGLSLSRVLFLAFVLVAYGLIVALALPRSAPHLLLLTLWTLPTLVLVISGVLRTDTPAGLHMVMRQMLKLETHFAIFLIVALVLAPWWGVLLHLASHLPI